MRIVIHNENGNCIAELISDIIEIRNTRDALDLIADCSEQGARKIIINEKNITSDFFDLKTGIAGDILQKFSNYDLMLAIVGDFSKYKSKSIKDFIYESNKTGRIFFVNSIEEAREKLGRE
ncbi:MAG: DUF4180 domain-containing protein [Bacteroidota bacterium]